MWKKMNIGQQAAQSNGIKVHPMIAPDNCLVAAPQLHFGKGGPKQNQVGLLSWENRIENLGQGD